MCNFAAAFLHLCCAQSKQFSVSWIVVQSSACMTLFLKRERDTDCLPLAQSGDTALKCSRMPPNKSSAMAGLCLQLA